MGVEPQRVRERQIYLAQRAWIWGLFSGYWEAIRVGMVWERRERKREIRGQKGKGRGERRGRDTACLGVGRACVFFYFY